ncbi:MAG TPA: ribonuclease HII [Candidatus Fimicola cottocaccae]|nr:ribonuclease HII [Candidatus Fimicola cottocaccae]
MSVSISDIKSEFELCPIENIEMLFLKYGNDERKGVINIIESYKKKIKALEVEKERIENLLVYEKELYSEGFEFIAGIDEVGRGPLAGPVVTASVILPKDCRIMGINDSKKLSEKKRNELYDIIIKEAVAYSFGVITAKEIDDINILQATYKAMKNSLESLSVKPDFVLADAVTIPNIEFKQKGIIKGDAKSLSIGAASIIAKVTRDRMMEEYSKLYPEYHFEKNKGYGSAEHIEAIKKYGICPIHRKSFLKNLIKV